MTANEQLSAKLKEVSFLYDASGDRYRAMAYGRAAKNVGNHPDRVSELSDPTVIVGVGPSISGTIKELVATGTCKRLEKLRNEEANKAPATVMEFEELNGVGPKTALWIWNTYHVGTLKALGALIKEGGVKDKIVEAYEQLKKVRRVPHAMMMRAVSPLLTAMGSVEGVQWVSVAGSLRRGKDRVRDVDVVVCCRDEDRATVIRGIRAVLENPGKGRVKVAGNIEVEGMLRHVDVSITNEEAWGACLLYLTGSKEHNVMMRSMAKEKGYTLNEYGLWRGDVCLASKTESSIYEALGMVYLKPEEREAWILRGMVITD